MSPKTTPSAVSTILRCAEVPSDAVQAVLPEPLQGGITGVVWRDFKPGGGTPGEVESGETGLPGVTVELRDSGGASVATATTEPDGTFSFEDVGAQVSEVRGEVGRLLAGARDDDSLAEEGAGFEPVEGGAEGDDLPDVDSGDAHVLARREVRPPGEGR